MTFVSYAQNFEDVMLWRALRHIENGFYVDVGANDPSIDSVTKAFYDRGWSGINVEPLQSHYLDLQRDRLRDINLQCAAGLVHGELDLWESDIRGWATNDKLVAAQHIQNGNTGKFLKVPSLPLADICNEYCKSDIHFLKIDVEGYEKKVLEGMDFSRFRPWVLVIEATRPNSPEEMFAEWESIVISSSYVYGYCDGVNRFYVASEHSELLDKLRFPPNVHDDFVLANHMSAELRLQESEAKARESEAKARESEAKARESEAKARESEAKARESEAKAREVSDTLVEVRALLNSIKKLNEENLLLAEQSTQQLQILLHSSSWRITKPLRVMKDLYTKFFCIK